MTVRMLVSPPGVIAVGALVVACSGGSPPDGPLEQAASAIGGDAASQGADLFDNALPGTNGRSCATCHVPGGHYALSIADVAARFAEDPGDPLFNPIDADYPGAAAPTYDHVKAGLIRVTLSLADNLDVIDASGNVITNAARTLDVWRGVPSVENTSYTAPYQYDGRFPTLEVQADAALHAHSQIDHEPTAAELHDISAFERTLFSDLAAWAVAQAVSAGLPPPDIEPVFPPGSDGAAGKALFARACAPCHGGGTQIEMVQTLRDQLHPVLNANGSVSVVTGPGGVQLPAKTYHDLHGRRKVNLGIAFGTYLGQIGAVPNLTGVDFQGYRLRFYTDATRTQKIVDLPPPPPSIGPNLAPQAFSVDPGLAVTTGDVLDWEAFDVPQLRGIKNTAPYFHDRSAPDLPTVLDFYSRFILGALPQLDLPRTLPPEGPGLPPEALSPAQKKQILAFLEQI
jgi:cytochrome c peroxidase